MNRCGRTLLILLVLVVGATAAWGQPCVSPQMLLNTGFESPAVGDGMFMAPDSWVITGTAQGFNPTIAQFTAETGLQVGATGATLVGSLCQNVTSSMIDGLTYCFAASGGFRLDFASGTPLLSLVNTTDGSGGCTVGGAGFAVDSLTPATCMFTATAAEAGDSLDACIESTTPSGQVVWDDTIATPVELQSFEIE